MDLSSGEDATTIKDLIAVTMSHSTSTRPTELMLIAHNTTFAVKLYQILSDPEDQHVSISWTSRRHAYSIKH